MSYCGHVPGFCGRRADCADTLCEGHPGHLYQEDGGHVFNGGVVFPMQEPEDGRPVPSVEQVETWPSRVLVALLLLLAIAAAVSPLAFI